MLKQVQHDESRKTWHTIVMRILLAIALALATPAMADPYGMIGSFTAKPGQRAALAGILLEATSGMPGCQSYVVAADIADADKLWITEIWDSKESHDASLALPTVRAAIARGRPLIAGMGGGVETRVLGGVPAK